MPKPIDDVRKSLRPMLDLLVTFGVAPEEIGNSIGWDVCLLSWMPPAPEALNCYDGSAVRPRVIDGGMRHSLLACRELRKAARYLLFGDGDPVDVLPHEIERDRVCWLLLETMGDLGRQPDNAGGILRNSCRTHCQPAKLRVPARGEIRTVRLGMALVLHLQSRRPSPQTNLGWNVQTSRTFP